MLIAGGGLNGSTIAGIRGGNPFNTIEALKGEFRCIYADLRNSAGESTGPLEIDRPWDSYTDDHLGLMDHLGIDKFMVLGFCIAGPFIWNLSSGRPIASSRRSRRSRSGSAGAARTALYDSQTDRLGRRTGQAAPRITSEWPTSS